MNTRHAHMILAIVREGSFTAAAKSLSITQPTLSQTVRQIEAQLGDAIFVRGNAVGDVMFYGRGAGNLPTASAVVADIIDILTHKDAEVFVPDWESAEGTPFDYTALPYAFLCRVQTAASYSDAVSALRNAYADAELLTAEDAFDGEIAFVTPVTTETAVREALATLGTVSSLLRIMP